MFEQFHYEELLPPDPDDYIPGDFFVPIPDYDDDDDFPYDYYDDVDDE